MDLRDASLGTCSPFTELGWLGWTIRRLVHVVNVSGHHVVEGRPRGCFGTFRPPQRKATVFVLLQMVSPNSKAVFLATGFLAVVTFALADCMSVNSANGERREGS